MILDVYELPQRDQAVIGYMFGSLNQMMIALEEELSVPRFQRFNVVLPESKAVAVFYQDTNNVISVKAVYSEDHCD